MPPFNKNKIAIALSERTGFSPTQSIRQIDAFLDIIKLALQDGHQVRLPSFGHFTVRKREPRKSRNPRTGESLVTQTSKIPVFTPSGAFRKTLNTEATFLGNRQCTAS